MRVKYVVGAPVWERAWSLPLWFNSVVANLPKRETGLIFVVPPSDQASRDAIEKLAQGFAFVDIMRDKHKPFDREHRGLEKHATLAHARNQLLQAVNGIRPDWYISWDSDLLIAPWTVPVIAKAGKPITTVWTWLNRQKPERIRHYDEATEEFRSVLWQDPMQATAMQWDDRAKRRACHFPGEGWSLYTKGWWETDAVLGFQMMDPRVYTTTRYAPHPDGEDIPFNLSLKDRDVSRWVFGERPGVHLYELDATELAMGYPDIMALAEQKPLAATHEPRNATDAILGFYPVEPVKAEHKIKT